MASRYFPRDSGDEILSEINVIPLVDISLVLLIIFMVTANYIMTSSFVVDIPKATHSQEIQASDTVTISISREGPIYLDNELVTTNALKEMIRNKHNKNPGLSIVLAVDKRTYFKDTATILDLLSELGITKLNIAVSQQ